MNRIRMGGMLLITGTSGIAAPTARLEASWGDTIFVTVKIRKECEELTAELQDFAFSVADVEDGHAVKSPVHACLSRYSGIDRVFDVAGPSERSRGDGLYTNAPQQLGGP